MGRKYLTDPDGPKLTWNNMEKGVTNVCQLATLDNPPLHFPLGKDAFGYIKKQLEALTKDMEQYESWSADL